MKRMCPFCQEEIIMIRHGLAPHKVTVQDTTVEKTCAGSGMYWQEVELREVLVQVQATFGLIMTEMQQANFGTAKDLVVQCSEKLEAILAYPY